MGVKAPAREVRLRADRSIDWFCRCNLPNLATGVLQAALLFDILIVVVLIGTLKISPLT